MDSRGDTQTEKPKTANEALESLSRVLGVDLEVFDKTPHQATLIPTNSEIPLIIHWHSPDWNIFEDLEESKEMLRDVLDASEKRVYYLSLIPEFQLSIDLLLDIFSEVFQPETSPLKHKNILEFLAMTNQDTLRLLSRGMQLKWLGNYPIQNFNTLEEATAYLKKELNITGEKPAQ